jgi:hypothetical protein
MPVSATVVEPFFCFDSGGLDQNGKKAPPRYYIVLDVEGQRRRCKVPFRYKRVMCHVSGGKTIQELVKGDVVQVEMEFTGGVWKLISVQTNSS